jgi:hypothetical protein
MIAAIFDIEVMRKLASMLRRISAKYRVLEMPDLNEPGVFIIDIEISEEMAAALRSAFPDIGLSPRTVASGQHFTGKIGLPTLAHRGCDSLRSSSVSSSGILDADRGHK